MSAVRTAIVDLLEGVDDIGRVHAFERYAKDEVNFRAFYTVAPVVRGWHVQRLAARRRQLGSGRELVTETWSVTGFLSLVDAESSELVMDGLVDAIMAAERADPTLGGVARGFAVDGVVGFQLVDAGPVTFASVLCHRARLSLLTQQVIASDGGDFAGVEGAAGQIVGAVVERVAETTGTAFGAIEGRLAFDGDDDPAAFPAAIVSPLGEQARMDPTTTDLDERVDIRIAVTIVGRSGYAPATEGALAAGGVEALANRVLNSLHGWQPAQVDVPFLFAGAQPVPAGPGLFAWQMTFSPSVYIEDQSDG